MEQLSTQQNSAPYADQGSHLHEQKRCSFVKGTPSEITLHNPHQLSQADHEFRERVRNTVPAFLKVEISSLNARYNGDIPPEVLEDCKTNCVKKAAAYVSKQQLTSSMIRDSSSLQHHFDMIPQQKFNLHISGMNNKQPTPNTATFATCIGDDTHNLETRTPGAHPTGLNLGVKRRWQDDANFMNSSGNEKRHWSKETRQIRGARPRMQTLDPVMEHRGSRVLQVEVNEMNVQTPEICGPVPYQSVEGAIHGRPWEL